MRRAEAVSLNWKKVHVQGRHFIVIVHSSGGAGIALRSAAAPPYSLLAIMLATIASALYGSQRRGEVTQIVRKRTYNWLHIPTGTRGESEFEQWSLSDSQVIRLVNEWNSKHGKVWFYWV